MHVISVVRMSHFTSKQLSVACCTYKHSHPSGFADSSTDSCPSRNHFPDFQSAELSHVLMSIRGVAFRFNQKS